MGVSDWVYWASHYLTSFFMHLIIVTLMLLFVCVKRNTEGRAFIQYSDPTLVFVILMFFCSQCLVHGIFLSTFFVNQHSAIAGAMLYWTFSCVMPFLMLEHGGGQGYYYIERKDKLLTAIFPGMSLHWSFRVLERFEKFVEHGANWGNFYDHDATPDNVTLAEIVFIGSMFDFTLAALLWYLDNVFSLGPGVHKPVYFPLMIRYWIPSRSFARAPARTAQELPNFENEPVDQPVAVDLVHVCKLVIMDEPTTNMDPEGRREIWEILLKLRRTTCILLTTHNLDEADVVGDRIAIMANGRIRNLLWYNGQIQHSALLTVGAYNDARLRNITGVEGAQFTFDVTDTGNVASATREEGEFVDSQNTYREILPKVLRSIFFPLVSSLMCSNFVLFPIAERALQGLSFTVRAGECFGLLGVNGVGKTTTFRILTGELLPHAGDAYIRPFSAVRDTRQFQRYLGYCPQKDGLLDMLTGVETLLFFVRLRGIAMTKEYLDALLDIFHLEEIADQLVSTYSLSDVEFLCNRIAILGDGTLQCLGSLAQLKEKFGKGYTITVNIYPDHKDDKYYQRELSAAICSNFPLAELVHTYEGVLEFRMSRVRMPWSQMFARMAGIKRLFKLKEFFIADTSLAQIFRSVTRKEASEAAAAAEKKLQQQPAVAGRITSTLGF
ncbi:hypothetical protein V5799_004908 [Amblyomma americanum]|uniref:ABC transporter domain-containing protein n=1 Tax=Amblyomma americanum TaxID=6943 RepID=A0AAQ4D4R7_AMBAM